MAVDEGRRVRVYTLHDNLDDEIAIEIKKMEHDLELYADDNLTAEEFIGRIKESESWIMHFVNMQRGLAIKLDMDKNGE